MPEVLDRDSGRSSFAEDRLPSATVAFHTFEGMVAEGRVAGVGTSAGTRSLYVSHRLPRWTRLSLVEFLGSALTAATDAVGSAVVEQTFVEHLREDDRRAALSDALGLVQTVQPLDLRAVLLTALGVRLPDDEGRAALSDALGLVDAVEHPEVRAVLMAVLAPPFQEEERLAAVSEAARGTEAGSDDNDPPGGGDSSPETGAMARMAWEVIGREGPGAETARPDVPDLTDEPVENIRRLFALTYGEFARLFDITERHAHRWHREGVPAERLRAVDALEAVGITIVGGLGPDGAKLWLYAGSPSRAERFTAGDVDELVAAADKHRDSPFT